MIKQHWFDGWTMLKPYFFDCPGGLWPLPCYPWIRMVQKPSQPWTGGIPAGEALRWKSAHALRQHGGTQNMICIYIYILILHIYIIYIIIYMYLYIYIDSCWCFLRWEHVLFFLFVGKMMIHHRIVGFQKCCDSLKWLLECHVHTIWVMCKWHLSLPPRWR